LDIVNIIIRKKDEMNEYLQGEIDKYCEAVLTGSKPCAMFPIQDRYIKEAEKFIKGHKLLSFREFLYPAWTTMWIYKRKFMLDVIKNLPEEPKTIYEHWVLGKAFGYSDEAIEEFLSSSKRSFMTFRTRR